ncbi:MAG: hypothetical protein GY856_15765, partial [bacterium]|nr:hypothetical protein [bacterium]
MNEERDGRDFAFPASRGERAELVAACGRVGAALSGDHEIAVRRTHSFTGSPATVVSHGAIADTDDSLHERARAHLAALASVLGGADLEYAADPAVRRTSGGAQLVHLHQHHRGIPVFEAVRTVRFDRAGAVQEVTGDSAPVPAEIDLQPMLSPQEATLAAARHLAATASGEPGEESPALKIPRSLPRVVASFPLPSRPTVLKKTPFAEGVTAGLVLFYRGHEVVLGWLVALALAATGDAWDLIVGANGA